MAELPPVGEYEVVYPEKKPYAAFICKAERRAQRTSNPSRGGRDLSEEARAAYLKLGPRSPKPLAFSKQRGREQLRQAASRLDVTSRPKVEKASLLDLEGRAKKETLDSFILSMHLNKHKVQEQIFAVNELEFTVNQSLLNIRMAQLKHQT